jgi:hypothetical protein
MLCHDREKRIDMGEVAHHPFFAGEGDPVLEIAAAAPKMKASSSLVFVQADVCVDDCVPGLPVASSWLGLRGYGPRQFPQPVW